ncbi:MAG: hypothetical protein K0R44_2210 [Thermomicrobiales bacterium]|nr:hypothetical protein [Thermomicrobiales bacterium]
MRHERSGLPLKAKNASVHIWLVEKHTGVVDEISSREVVRAVENHVVLGEDIQHVALIQPRLVLDHVHVRVQCCNGNPRRFGMPTRSVVWTTWRCKFDSSTMSASTIPSVPTPAAAR